MHRRKVHAGTAHHDPEPGQSRQGRTEKGGKYRLPAV